MRQFGWGAVLACTLIAAGCQGEPPLSEKDLPDNMKYDKNEERPAAGNVPPPPQMDPNLPYKPRR